jgi:hypothetical protein
MSHIIIDWNHFTTSNPEMEIIDIYPTNLIEIPLDEYDLADFAYYEALGKSLAETSEIISSLKSR